MISCSSKLRRARLLLGTLVEITVEGPKAALLHAAVESAFAAIHRVQTLMSVHDKDSEVSFLNRLAVRRAVAVSEWTCEVLVEALRLSRLSRGVFDITIAPTLFSWGFISGPVRGSACRNASWTDIELLSRRRVRFRRPLAIDLGGIAKGFAVDKAVEVLVSAGADSGVVNAGGDLRVFGRKPRQIHVRHPIAPGQLLPLLQLQNEAIATSAAYFSKRVWRGRLVSHLVHAPTRKPMTAPISISVRAPRCVLADALTKVVLAGRRIAEPVLAALDAEALILSE